MKDLLFKFETYDEIINWEKRSQDQKLKWLATGGERHPGQPRGGFRAEVDITQWWQEPECRGQAWNRPWVTLPDPLVPGQRLSIGNWNLFQYGQRMGFSGWIWPLLNTIKHFPVFWDVFSCAITLLPRPSYKIIEEERIVARGPNINGSSSPNRRSCLSQGQDRTQDFLTALCRVCPGAAGLHIQVVFN